MPNQKVGVVALLFQPTPSVGKENRCGSRKLVEGAPPRSALGHGGPKIGRISLGAGRVATRFADENVMGTTSRPTSGVHT